MIDLEKFDAPIQRARKLFGDLSLETKLQEVPTLVKIVVEMEPNRKAVCFIVGVKYNADQMKHCSQDVFAKRVTMEFMSKVLTPIFG